MRPDGKRFKAEQEQPQERGSGLFQFFAMLTVVFIATFLIRTFIIAPYQIPSGSMIPTIEIGDCVFAEKVTYGLGSDIERNDIVTFEDPNNPQITLIKRVVAVEGDEVNIIDGMLYINGEQLNEPYLAEQGVVYPANGGIITYPYTVPEDHVWTMGDNRNNSADSRFYGPVSEESVSGRAILRYWPLNRIGPVDAADV